MKKIIIVLAAMLLSNCNAISQSSTATTFQTLETNLIKFMIENGDITGSEIQDYTSGKYHLRIAGVQNDYSKGTLKKGIYSFGRLTTHTKSYFVIWENDKYRILNLSSRDGLDNSINDVLDFCERNNYCVDITNDYISRLLRVFYKKNLNVGAGMDVNCEHGTKDTKELP